METGNETSFNEPFNLKQTIKDAVKIYRPEAERRKIEFHLDLTDSPRDVIGDGTKIRTAVQNLTANALKYTDRGSVTVKSAVYDEPEGLRSNTQTAVNITVADTGRGIPPDKLEMIFREFEQVDSVGEEAEEATVGPSLLTPWIMLSDIHIRSWPCCGF